MANLTRRALLAALPALPFIGPALAAMRVGTVARLKGACTATGASGTVTLAAGVPIELGHLLATGADARLEIAFIDGTILTIGARAKLRVDAFVFAPGGRGNRLRLSAIGSFRFVSGHISKSPASQVDVDTNFATIGVRGTDFWAGPIDRRFGVFLQEGAVTVSNIAGRAILDAPGEGTNIATIGSAPGPVTQWPADKVARALASVAF